jgi:hypothetical protein
MDLKTTVMFDVRLTSNELRLVGLALAGKLTVGRDRAAAHDLNLRILELRQHQLAEAQSSARGALEQARALPAPVDDEGAAGSAPKAVAG